MPSRSNVDVRSGCGGAGLEATGMAGDLLGCGIECWKFVGAGDACRDGVAVDREAKGSTFLGGGCFDEIWGRGVVGFDEG